MSKIREFIRQIFKKDDVRIEVPVAMRIKV
jgi:hypothetical protein